MSIILVSVAILLSADAKAFIRLKTRLGGLDGHMHLGQGPRKHLGIFADVSFVDVYGCGRGTGLGFEAYDYYLARCLEAGIGPDDAAAAWDIHSSEAFEAALVEAESVGSQCDADD